MAKKQAHVTAQPSADAKAKEVIYAVAAQSSLTATQVAAYPAMRLGLPDANNFGAGLNQFGLNAVRVRLNAFRATYGAAALSSSDVSADKTVQQLIDKM